MASDLREHADASRTLAKRASEAALQARETAILAHQTCLAANKAAQQAQVQANWAWVIANAAIKAADDEDAATAAMWQRVAQHAAEK